MFNQRNVLFCILKKKKEIVVIVDLKSEKKEPV